MNNQGLPEIIRDLPQVWKGLGRNRQILIGGAAGVVAISLIFALLVLRQPETVALYSNLDQQDASAIVAKLKELETPYTIADGGTTIRVPRDSVAELRLQLAGLGIPAGSAGASVGMELFDKTNLGLTDFAQRLNFQRGLEGELARTISRLAPIESARVHLVLPEERLFTAQQKDATASVVLKLKPAAKLADDQVSSIQHLVAKSVEGLKPENVAIVDINGNTLGTLGLNGGAGKPSDKQLAARLEVQHQRETELEHKIQSLLDTVLGPNHAVVRASVALDWDQVEQQIETFSPNDLPAQVRSQRETRENVAGQGADGAAPAGVPGAEAIPTYQGEDAGAAGQNATYQRSDVTTNYEISSEKQQIVRAPGEIKNIGIAVTVDQSVQAAQVDQITQLVTAAAGLQAQRGDQISVVSLPFDDTLEVQTAKLQSDQQRMEWIELGAKLAGVLVALGGLFVLFRYLTRSVRPREAMALPSAQAARLDGARGLLPDGTALPGDEAAPALLTDAETALAQAQIEAVQTANQVMRKQAARQARSEVEAAQRKMARESVVQLAKTKPEALAAMLTAWLQENDGPPSSGK
ncbi:MAG: flagellar basal-body MS-ring/collar protein FliF [Chloroflexota bacterium]